MIKKILILFVSFYSFLPANECLSKLESKSKKIKQLLKEEGVVFIRTCANISPYIYIALVNMEDSRNKISITHEKKVARGYPLKTIFEHARRDKTIISVNGYMWDEDEGTNDNQFANNPTGTVYSKKQLLHKRNNNKEVLLAFGERAYSGTKVLFVDKTAGENLPDDYKINVDNSQASIIKNSVSSVKQDEDVFISAIGVGKFNEHNILLITSTSFQGRSSTKDLSDIFQFFDSTSAMRLDGNSAASLAINQRHVNPLDEASLFYRYFLTTRYGSARHIMYTIAVQRVPPIPKPTKKPPVLEGGVNIVPIEEGLKINSRVAQGEVERYEFYRSTQSGKIGDKIHADTVNTYEDKELIDGTTYYYTVKACNEAGCDASSQDYYTYDNNQTDPTKDPNKVCVSNYFKYYGDGQIHDSLKKGDKDAELYSDGTKHQVKELQEFLEAFGYNVGSSGADGWFGSDTKDALIEFQDANGLDADGIVGPNTREVMNSTNCYDK